MNAPLLGLFIYFIIMAIVEVWTWGKARTKEKVNLGNRRLEAWIISLSDQAAAESAWPILGLSGTFFFRYDRNLDCQK